jgi:small nuclear ribonucleoprotein (snRNP)-like protein
MPASLTALLILVLAAAPGYAALRVIERRSPRDPVSPIRETIEYVSVGLLASAVIAFLLLGAAEITSALLPLRGLIGGPGYLRAHPWQLILSGLLQVILATGLAAAAGMLLVRKLVPRVNRQGHLWHPVLARNEEGRDAYVAIELTDGRLVEGLVLAYSSSVNPSDREIAVQGPIAVTPPGGVRTRSAASTIVISGGQIRMITVGFPELRSRSS